MATTTLTSRSPLDLPELRHRISRFVTLKDAQSCIHVCKAWTTDFISVIWHTIDLAEQSRFFSLSNDIISIHGHHVRAIINCNSIEGISLLANASICELKRLGIKMSENEEHNSLVLQIIQRNIRSLTYLDAYLFSEWIIYNCNRSLFPTTGLAPSSNQMLAMAPPLTQFRIDGIYLSQNDLVTVLHGYPALSHLMLSRVKLEGDLDTSFKHTHLRKLSASIECLFSPNSDSSLLAYFPNLSFLCPWMDTYVLSIPSQRIREIIDHYCPHLIEYEVSSLGETSSYLLDVFDKITHINVDFGESDDPNLEVSSILRHKATLKEISAYSYISFGSDEVAHVSYIFRTSKDLLQWIPRSCPKLEILDLHLYEMEMDDIEGGEWVCKDLKKLRIRVYGLNTKESILRTVELWRKGCRERWRKQTIECRREKGQEKAEDMIKTDEQGKERIQDQEEIDTSIEARVARHLLKFVKLQKVWLGYRSWRVT